MNELLTMLAIAYVTYVIIESHFPPVAWARDAILDRVADGGSIMYLLTCWWCASFWIGLTMVGSLRLLEVPLRVPAMLVLASSLISGFAGMIYGVLDLTHANLVKGLTRE